MKLARPCLACGQPTRNGSRCLTCGPRTTTERGYGADWQHIARAAIAAQPWCSRCGATSNLTADHVHPLVAGGSTHGPVDVLCRSCNGRKGASSDQLAARMTPSGPEPITLRDGPSRGVVA